MVLVATSRNLDIREVLKHFWALSNRDGTRKITHKSTQSTLARHIESRVAPAEFYSISISIHYRWY